MNKIEKIFVLLLVLSCKNKFNLTKTQNMEKGGEVATAIQPSFSATSMNTLNVVRKDIGNENTFLNINLSSSFPYYPFREIDHPSLFGIYKIPFSVYFPNNILCVSYLSYNVSFARCTELSNMSNVLVDTYQITHLSDSDYKYVTYNFMKFNDENGKNKYLSLVGKKFIKLSLHELTDQGINKIIDNVDIPGSINEGHMAMFIMKGGKYFSISLRRDSNKAFIFNYQINQANSSISQIGEGFMLERSPRFTVFFEKDNFAIVLYNTFNYLEEEGKILYMALYDILETKGKEKKVFSKISSREKACISLGNQNINVLDYDLDNNIFVLLYYNSLPTGPSIIYAALTKLERDKVTGKIKKTLTEVKVNNDLYPYKGSYTPVSIKYLPNLKIWFFLYIAPVLNNRHYFVRFYKKDKNDNLHPLTNSIELGNTYFTKVNYIPVNQNKGKCLLTAHSKTNNEIKFLEIDIELVKTFTSSTIKVTTTSSEPTSSSTIVEEKTTNTIKIPPTTTLVEPTDIVNVTDEPSSSSKAANNESITMTRARVVNVNTSTSTTIKPTNKSDLPIPSTIPLDNTNIIDDSFQQPTEEESIDKKSNNTSVIAAAFGGIISTFVGTVVAVKCYLTKNRKVNVVLDDQTAVIGMHNNPMFETNKPNYYSDKALTDADNYDVIDSEAPKDEYIETEGYADLEGPHKQYSQHDKQGIKNISHSESIEDTEPYDVIENEEYFNTDGYSTLTGPHNKYLQHENKYQQILEESAYDFAHDGIPENAGAYDILDENEEYLQTLPTVAIQDDRAY